MRIEHLHFSDQAFHGINEKYSLENDALFIMQRVLTLGSIDDIRIIDAYYGEARIKNEIIQVPYLNNKVLNLCCVLYNLEKNDFLFNANMNRVQLNVYSKSIRFLWPGKDIDEAYCENFDDLFTSSVQAQLN